ncbi:MAG: glycoside hydrolase family 47 protein [Bacteroidetes bacterium]|nr:glycoside hydrolase family 47 protein [Bacteroidota bacterium]
MDETKEIEAYVVDSLNFNKDIDAKVFEVNIRILGGLLAMYELSGNAKVLDKARDFADRMMPAFNTATGIPKYWVNLRTGVAKGDTVNVAEVYDGKLWYGRVNMNTGLQTSSVITLYDAFFPAILALSGDTARAVDLQKTWNWLWNKYGLEPSAYDYKKGTPNYPVYDLNPEIIESAYYLYNITGDTAYYNMNRNFWNDIKKYCKTDIAFTSVENVETMKKRDYMPTFFFAETLKYLYLTFSHHQSNFNFDEHLFNTEAHQFKKRNFNHNEAKIRLGFD